MDERSEYLAHVASLYYEDNLTQDEIARRITTSRSTVSRLLHEAREAGLVEIVVHHPWKTVPELEEVLVARFHLLKAYVLRGNGKSYPELLRGLGVLAAQCIQGILREGTVLGISWGAAVYHTVRALRPERPMPITVVQMVGAVGEGDPLIDGPELARWLANLYGGSYRYLHAPLIVEDARVRDVFLHESRIRETLALARRADVALVGIGAPDTQVCSLLRAGYLDSEALDTLRAQGVVGDICARHYDVHGGAVDIPMNQRVVGIELEALQGIKQVIGVAGGERKAEAILGALNGGYVNVLVTDEAVATRVLELVG
jgi:DNA-binding transcriptional regulator LsrR (DeoR family)